MNVVTKPTKEFLEKQPYLYRAFAFGGAEIEVYDDSLDDWPTDARLLVDGAPPPPDGPHDAYPLSWSFRRHDQQDTVTGQKFSVLVFNAAGALRGYFGDYKATPGTYKLDLVVNGEIQRTSYLTIIPWSDPEVSVVDEEEVNGDLVRLTFEVRWPDNLSKVMAIIAGEDGGWNTNGPTKGFMSGSLELNHNQGSATTTIKGVTYRWMSGQEILLSVGAESVTGAKDVGGKYLGCIDRIIVYIGFERGAYGELAPHTRHGFRVGMGSIMDGNTVYSVGGSPLGRLWPFGKFTTTHDRSKVHGGSWNIKQVAPKLECVSSETRASGVRHFSGIEYQVSTDLDNDSKVFSTDVSGSRPSWIVDSSDNTPRQYAVVSCANGLVSWGMGEFMTPMFTYEFFGHSSGGGMSDVGNIVKLRTKNVGTVPFFLTTKTIETGKSDYYAIDKYYIGTDSDTDPSAYIAGRHTSLSMRASRPGSGSVFDTHHHVTKVYKLTAYDESTMSPELQQLIENGGF